MRPAGADAARKAQRVCRRAHRDGERTPRRSTWSTHPGNFYFGVEPPKENFSPARRARSSRAGRGRAERGREPPGPRGSPRGWRPPGRVLPSPPGAPGARGEDTHQAEREEDGEQGEAGAHDDEQQEDDERVLLAHAVVGFVEPVPGPLQPVSAARRRLGAVPQVAAPPHRLLPHRGGSRGARRARPAGAAPPAGVPPARLLGRPGLHALRAARRGLRRGRSSAPRGWAAASGAAPGGAAAASAREGAGATGALGPPLPPPRAAQPGPPPAAAAAAAPRRRGRARWGRHEAEGRVLGRRNRPRPDTRAPAPWTRPHSAPARAASLRGRRLSWGVGGGGSAPTVPYAVRERPCWGGFPLSVPPPTSHLAGTMRGLLTAPH